MSRVIDSSNRSQGRRDARFPAVVDVTALVAAASTALCMHIGVPAWGMFAGWVAFVTGGGGGRVTRYCG